MCNTRSKDKRLKRKEEKKKKEKKAVYYEQTTCSFNKRVQEGCHNNVPFNVVCVWVFYKYRPESRLAGSDKSWLLLM